MSEREKHPRVAKLLEMIKSGEREAALDEAELVKQEFDDEQVPVDDRCEIREVLAIIFFFTAAA